MSLGKFGRGGPLLRTGKVISEVAEFEKGVESQLLVHIRS